MLIASGVAVFMQARTEERAANCTSSLPVRSLRSISNISSNESLPIPVRQGVEWLIDLIGQV